MNKGSPLPRRSGELVKGVRLVVTNLQLEHEH